MDELSIRGQHCASSCQIQGGHPRRPPRCEPNTPRVTKTRNHMRARRILILLKHRAGLRTDVDIYSASSLVKATKSNTRTSSSTAWLKSRSSLIPRSRILPQHPSLEADMWTRPHLFWSLSTKAGHARRHERRDNRLFRTHSGTRLALLRHAVGSLRTRPPHPARPATLSHWSRPWNRDVKVHRKLQPTAALCSPINN